MIINFNEYLQERKGCRHMNKVLENLCGKTPEEILKEYKISTEPPIDLELLMERIGITTKEHDFSVVEDATGFEKNSILGATLLEDDEVLILHKEYEKKRNDHGKRFTIAHELGHCVLHADNLTKNHLELRADIYNKDDDHEMQASRFAGKLLIPEKSLRRISEEMVIPFLSTLATIFDVSTGVMKERLDEAKINYFNDVLSEIKM